MKLSNRLKGQRAHAAGDQLEETLELAHAVYAAQGVAKMARSHPKMVGKPGQGRYGPKGAVDFVGIALGRGVCFDAKSLGDDLSYAVPARDMHQLDFMLDFQRCGGLAFYLLADQTMQVREAYLLPVSERLRTVRVAVRERRKYEGGRVDYRSDLPTLKLGLPSQALLKRREPVVSYWWVEQLLAVSALQDRLLVG